MCGGRIARPVDVSRTAADRRRHGRVGHQRRRRYGRLGHRRRRRHRRLGHDDEGDTVVWGTSCTDPSCEPVIWPKPLDACQRARGSDQGQGTSRATVCRWRSAAARGAALRRARHRRRHLARSPHGLPRRFPSRSCSLAARRRRVPDLDRGRSTSRFRSRAARRCRSRTPPI